MKNPVIVLPSQEALMGEKTIPCQYCGKDVPVGGGCNADQARECLNMQSDSDDDVVPHPDEDSR